MMTSHIINIPVLITPLFAAVVVAKNIFFPPVIREYIPFFRHTYHNTQSGTDGQVLFRIFSKDFILSRLLFVVFLKSCEFCPFVGSKIALVQRGPDFCHHIVVEIQVVQNTEPHAEHLFCFQQMTDVALL